MEENKYYCPKYGYKLATTRWDKIDLYRTKYKVLIVSELNPSLEHI